VNFAKEVRDAASMPVMVVGGFRSAPAMIESLDKGELDLVGIARPMIAEPGGPKRLHSGEIERLPSFEKTFDIFHLMPWNYMQLERMGDGLEPDLAMTGKPLSPRSPNAKAGTWRHSSITAVAVPREPSAVL
jgi:hypothetical protein